MPKLVESAVDRATNPYANNQTCYFYDPSYSNSCSSLNPIPIHGCTGCKFFHDKNDPEFNTLMRKHKQWNLFRQGYKPNFINQ